MGGCLKKIFFSRSTEPKITKTMWKHPDRLYIQVYSNGDPWGQIGATIGAKFKDRFILGNIFKNFLLKNSKCTVCQIDKETSWCSLDSSLFKWWLQGWGWGHNGWLMLKKFKNEKTCIQNIQLKKKWATIC